MSVSDSIHFVFNERNIDRINGRLALWAFTPRKESGRLCLSTCRDENLTNSAAWELGERLRTFIHSRKKSNGSTTLLGRADMKAATYENQGLDFDTAPFKNIPEHTNVIGWEQAALNSGTNHEQIALLISLDSLFIPRT